MSVGHADERSTRHRLKTMLEATGMPRPHAQQIADAISTLINTKIAKSEGRHHAKFHKLKSSDLPEPPVNETL